MYITHETQYAVINDLFMQFMGNQASYGGAIYVAKGSGELFIAASISGNYATKCGGGLAFGPNVTLTVTSDYYGGVVSYNTADQAGGAFYVSPGSNISITNLEVSYNNATIAGRRDLLE